MQASGNGHNGNGNGHSRARGSIEQVFGVGDMTKHLLDVYKKDVIVRDGGNGVFEITIPKDFARVMGIKTHSKGELSLKLLDDGLAAVFSPKRSATTAAPIPVLQTS